jgi:predicted nucleic acid-binding Zn ribbon protein
MALQFNPDEFPQRVVYTMVCDGCGDAELVKGDDDRPPDQPCRRCGSTVEKRIAAVTRIALTPWGSVVIEPAAPDR